MARRLSWVAAVRDIKDDRTTRADVRCEPLRTSPDKALIAWRGRSGRRYVFRSLPAADVDAGALFGSVVLGVTADGKIVSAAAHCSLGTVAAMIESGAVTVHIHTLCDTAAERADVARDLRPLAMEAA